jgi:hypothetical protein
VNEAASGFVGLVLIGCSLVIYVAPTIIGWQRRVAGAGALAILNVLLGWTGLGWIGCMLWAVCAHTHQNQFYQNQAGRFTEQQIAEHEEFVRWKAQKSLPVGERRTSDPPPADYRHR